MLFNTVGIFLTNKCTAACKMCCYECSPANTQKVDSKLVFDVIEQAGQIPYIKEIVFSGGEPFLNYDELYSYIISASSKGLFISCYTNAFWCTSLNYTEERLKDLKMKGLKIIRTSYDYYHSQYIPYEYMKNLLLAAKHVGLKCTLSVGMDKKTLEELPNIFKRLSLSFLDIDVIFYPFMRVGNAVNNLKNEDIIRNIDIDGLRCKFDRILAIMYDGTAYPCCGPCMIPSLSIGNIKEQSLSELTKKYKDNLFFSKILTKGVRGIANDIRERQLFEIADYYVDACDFCRDIFDDNYKTSILEKFYRTEKNVMN